MKKKIRDYFLILQQSILYPKKSSIKKKIIFLNNFNLIKFKKLFDNLKIKIYNLVKAREKTLEICKKKKWNNKF